MAFFEDDESDFFEAESFASARASDCFDEPLPSLLPSLFPLPPSEPESLLDEEDGRRELEAEPARESVEYQPEPLNMIGRA